MYTSILVTKGRDGKGISPVRLVISTRAEDEESKVSKRKEQ